VTPFALGVFILQGLLRFDPAFLWLKPGYEYNDSSPPIDLLLGTSRWRTDVLLSRGTTGGATPAAMAPRWGNLAADEIVEAELANASREAQSFVTAAETNGDLLYH
jgi:hypothetical protein